MNQEEMKLLTVAIIVSTDICFKKQKVQEEEKTPEKVDTALVERTGWTSCSFYTST